MNFSAAVAAFFAPFFQPSLLNVDWLDKRPNAFSVESSGDPHILRRYTTGRTLCAFDFYLTARLAYSRDRISNEDNLALWNSLTLWIQARSLAGNLPALPDGFIPQALQTLRPGFLDHSGDNGSGVYKLPCRLLYFT